MITISRSLLRAVQSVFRRAGIGRSSGGPTAPLHITAGDDGLRIQGRAQDTAIEFLEPGPHPAESFCLPATFLRDCESRRNEVVQLAMRTEKCVAASWIHRGVPQHREYPVGGQPAAFPQPPGKMSQHGPELLTALRSALEVVDKASGRYALNHLQLTGGPNGRITGTDGRQIFVEQGFDFPWDGALLVPASGALKSAELPAHQPVAIGHNQGWLTIRIGPWSIALRVNGDGRFPKVESVIPCAASATTRLHVQGDDARFLADAISGLPDAFESTQAESRHAVTLDLNGRIAVRAGGTATAPGIELVLGRSSYEGQPVKLATNRHLLMRAVALGFRDLHFFGPDKPVLCEAGRRQYVWATFEATAAVESTSSTVRVDSAAAGGPQRDQNPEPPARIARSTSQPKRTMPMTSRPQESNSRHVPITPENNHPAAPVSPIDQAEALRGTLREALNRTSELVACLRRQRKQNRLMKSTLDSLKELQRVAG